MGERLLAMHEELKRQVRAGIVARLALDIWRARNVHDGQPVDYIDDAADLLDQAESALLLSARQ